LSQTGFSVINFTFDKFLNFTLIYNVKLIFPIFFISRNRSVWLVRGRGLACKTRLENANLPSDDDDDNERGEWRTWTRARFSFVVISVAISLRPRFGECRDARDGAALIRRYRGSAAEARSGRGGHG